MENDTSNVSSGYGSLVSPEPAAKRAKLPAKPKELINGNAQLSLLQPSIFSDKSREELRARFESSGPYTHLVLRDLFKQDLLVQVREEIINNLQATYKETDLFKVFQTGDLANIDANDPEHAEKLPALLALRQELYSPHFRQYVRDVTGCGELADKTDCSCNTYAQGGHLLCHDDVIGSRRVSYIIYLTDPECPWQEADGGALELYPLDGPYTPSVNPSVSHPPYWNSMAMFTVQPGKSFHAVQEVMTADNPRLSISGWYHAPQLPQDADKASLQQLQKGEDMQKQYTPFEGEMDGAAGEMSPEDMAVLLRYINPVYLSDQSWEPIVVRFKEEGSVQLRDFLKKSIADKLLEQLLVEDEGAGLGCSKMPHYQAGVGAGWEAVGPAHKQRYLRYTAPSPPPTIGEAAALGPLLQHLQRHLFSSGAFARLLQRMTTIRQLGYSGEVRRFRPGLDYTLAHFGVLTKDPRLDCVLCVCDSRPGDAAEAWEAGEVGGFEAYLLADEDEKTAAEVYRQDTEESGVLNVSAAHNTLNLVLRDEGLMRFVKYVSYAAPSSRWDIAMEYLPEDDDDEEGEEEGEGSGDAAAMC